MGKAKRVLCAAMSIMLAGTTFVGCKSNAGTSKVGTAGKPVTVDMLFCWNGGSGSVAQDQVNNTVAKEIAKKTGVMLNIQTITTSEAEKLNTMFASGDVPDLTNAPYWGIDGGEGKAIKKAAEDGLLMSLNGKLNKYPNVKRLLTNGVEKGFSTYCLNPSSFNGKQYLIPQQTPNSDEDVTNWEYNLFVRQDILKALNISADSIDTSDKVYDLLVKIKNGNFKDTTGKPVVPAGAWHNGWDYTQLLKSFDTLHLSGNYRMENGKVIRYEDSSVEDQKVLFMRKLISQGLFDPEALSQTDTVAKQKMATGKIAVFGTQYGQVSGFMPSTVYKDHPEMKYVPVGPLKHSDGDTATQLSTHGRAGFPIMFIGAKSKKADAVLKLLNYINSPEGIKLAKFGVENTDYTVKNNQPQLLDKWENAKNNDNTAYANEGLAFYMNLVGSDPTPSLYPTPKTDDEKEAIAKSKVEFTDKVSADYIAMQSPDYSAFTEKMSTIDYGNDVFYKACMASSDAQAEQILNDYRSKLKAAGADKLCSYVQEHKTSDTGF